jgi:hypothetical protein
MALHRRKLRTHRWIQWLSVAIILFLVIEAICILHYQWWHPLTHYLLAYFRQSPSTL